MLSAVGVVTVTGDDRNAGHSGDLKNPVVRVGNLLDQAVGNPAAEPADIRLIGELPAAAQQARIGDQVDTDVRVPGECHQCRHHEVEPTQGPQARPPDRLLAHDVGEIDQVVGAVR